MASQASASAEELKQKGNELFGQKRYEDAIAKYTEAIAVNTTTILDGESASAESKRFEAVLYANRSACEANLERCVLKINTYTLSILTVSV